MRVRLIALLLQTSIIQLLGQQLPQFQDPVNIPMYLSGNFGELRPDHFHSGIDIKTQGTTGHPVYSIGDGYVSRIKVQANGYGKSIYVTHPDGYTSQYGHLDRYRDDIAEYVRRMQYRFRSHQVDLYPDRELFPLDKGDLMAYSGNTGSSSGPHLHFEVRNAADQVPTNVLKYDFSISDNSPPRFLSLFVYPLQGEGNVNGSSGKFHTRVVKDGERYTIPFGTEISGGGRIGISVEVFDYLNGASNRCAVYRLEAFVDGELTYSYQMDRFSFADTRYVNAHMDYEALIGSGIRSHRLHRLPNNRLPVYGNLRNDGVLEPEPDRDYEIRVLATDVAGNQSELLFTISGERSDPVPDEKVNSHLKWNEYNRFEAEDVRVEIPANALYQDLEFTYDRSASNSGLLSDFYHIASQETPLHLPYSLAIRTDIMDPELQPKLLLVTINDEQELESAGGEYLDGAVVADLRTFGAYAVALDTVAPQVRPLHRVADDMSGVRELRFNITDDLSGIERYEGYIDEQWVLFEYDLKNDLLTYTFDSDRIRSGSTHTLELYVTDVKGNATLYQSEFIW